MSSVLVSCCCLRCQPLFDCLNYCNGCMESRKCRTRFSTYFFPSLNCPLCSSMANPPLTIIVVISEHILSLLLMSDSYPWPILLPSVSFTFLPLLLILNTIYGSHPIVFLLSPWILTWGCTRPYLSPCLTKHLWIWWFLWFFAWALYKSWSNGLITIKQSSAIHESL